MAWTCSECGRSVSGTDYRRRDGEVVCTDCLPTVEARCDSCEWSREYLSEANAEHFRDVHNRDEHDGAPVAEVVADV